MGIYLSSWEQIIQIIIAQSAEAGEYTDCFYAEG